MCGLLKSKYNYIRWGFLFVLERLLMSCKVLLDEHEMQLSNNKDLEHGKKDWHLEKSHCSDRHYEQCFVFGVSDK
jgi:hypothetical protein